MQRYILSSEIIDESYCGVLHRIILRSNSRKISKLCFHLPPRRLKHIYQKSVKNTAIGVPFIDGERMRWRGTTFYALRRLTLQLEMF